MKITICIIFALMLTGTVFIQTAIAGQKAEAAGYGSEKKAAAPGYGDSSINKGHALFNDKHLGNGMAGKSCNSCHANGKGLEAAGSKQMFNIFGEMQHSLEEAVNFCIVNALKGTAIDPKSREMKNIVAYIKSLKK